MALQPFKGLGLLYNLLPVVSGSELSSLVGILSHLSQEFFIAIYRPIQSSNYYLVSLTLVSVRGCRAVAIRTRGTTCLRVEARLPRKLRPRRRRCRRRHPPSHRPPNLDRNIDTLSSRWDIDDKGLRQQV